MSGNDGLREFLRQRIAEVERKARERGPQPWHGFWGPEHRGPRGIVTPEEMTGGERLTLMCTQTGLAPREQRGLVQRWCDLLPRLAGVRHLWLESRVPQELFDAACAMPALESLWVKWGGVKSIDALAEASALRALHLGSSPGVTDLSPLARAPRLTWLELENLKRITDLAPLAVLTRLEGLGFSGAEGQRNSVESLGPLAALTNLRWLHLGAIHVRDESLRPLAMLTNLRWLGLGNFFSTEAFAALARELPNTACTWFAPFESFDISVFRCERCKANARVMTSGKGSRLLCPECDAKALAAHVARFDAARRRTLQ